MRRVTNLYPIVFFFSLCMCANIFAQPLTGTKTIGGANPDYPTIHEAVSALNSSIVRSNGVTFRIRAGNYHERSLVINAILDATHRAMFCVDSGATVSITFDSTASDTCSLKLCSPYITFDGSWNGDSHGRHITICGNVPADLVWITSGASYDVFKNCTFQILSDNANGSCIDIRSPTLSVTNPLVGVQFYECDIVGGGNGVSQFGQSNGSFFVDSTVFQNCDISNFVFYGMWFYYSSNVDVSHNRIFDTEPQASNTARVGIHSEFSNNINICSNRIGPFMNNGNQTGISFGILADGLTVVNNMIALGENTNGGVYGISLTPTAYSTRHNKLLFNTVLLSGVSAADVGSYALYENLSSTTTSLDTVWGNIFQNTRTGGTTGDIYGNFAILMQFGSMFPFSDYNVLSVSNDNSNDNCYVAGIYDSNNSIIHRYNTISELLGSSWSPRDMHSFSGLVPFVSDSDLHIRTDSATVVESGAPHHWQVPTDFDGDIRSSPMCDIGADEGNFTPLSVRNEAFAIPKAFSLSPIYPNPFNATATIRFSLPIASTVKGEIFDITGRKVFELLEGKYAAGSHTIQFDGSKLASGMYFVRLTAGKFVAQEKLVLLK